MLPREFRSVGPDEFDNTIAEDGMTATKVDYNIVPFRDGKG